MTDTIAVRDYTGATAGRINGYRAVAVINALFYIGYHSPAHITALVAEYRSARHWEERYSELYAPLALP